MSNPVDDRQAWFQRFKPITAPRSRLVCLPHAGAGASAFRSWPAQLPDDIELLAVRYPGRHDRLLEPCVEDMDELADRITTALQPHLSKPLALFGHSMGASVAYEIAIRLEQQGHRPTALLVSAQSPPHRAHHLDAHLHGDDALIAEVHRLGNADPAVLDHPDLRELILPALRADFTLLANYRRDPPHILDTPITAYVGTHDPDVAAHTLARWADLTTAGAAVKTYPGDHFYLLDNETQLVADIISRLRQPSTNVHT
jgi:pyochelin biosynthetic protein PchC